MWCSLAKVWVILILGLFIGSNNLNDRGSNVNPGCPTCIEAKPLNLKPKSLNRLKLGKTSKPVAILLAFNTLSPSSKSKISAIEINPTLISEPESSEESVEILAMTNGGKASVRASQALERFLRPLLDNGDLESTSSEEAVKDSWQCKRDELVNLLRSVLKKKEQVLANKHGVIHGVLSEEDNSEGVSPTTPPTSTSTVTPSLSEPNESEIGGLIPNPIPEETKAKTLQCVKNIITEVTEKGQESLGSIVKQFFSDLLKDLSVPFGDISKKIEAYKPLIEKIENEITTKIKEILEKLSQGPSNEIQDVVKDIVKKLVESVIGLLSPKSKPELSDLKSPLKPAAVQAIMGKVFNDLSLSDKEPESLHGKLPSLPETIEKLKEIPEKIEEKLIQSLRKIFKDHDPTGDLPSLDSVKNAVEDLIKDILSPDEKILTDLLNLLTPIIEEITKHLHNAVQKIAVNVRKHGSDNLEDIVKNVIKELVKDVMKSITGNDNEEESHLDESLEDITSPSILPFPETVPHEFLPSVDKILEKLLPGNHDIDNPCERHNRAGRSKHLKFGSSDMLKVTNPFHYIGKKILGGLKDILIKVETHSIQDLKNTVEIVMKKIGEDLISAHYAKHRISEEIFKSLLEKINQNVLECIKNMETARSSTGELRDALKSAIKQLLKHVAELFIPSSDFEEIPDELLVLIEDIVEILLKKGPGFHGPQFGKPSLVEILQKISPFDDEIHDKIWEPVKLILEKIAKNNGENIEGAVKEIVEKLIKDMIPVDKSTPDHLPETLQPIIKKVIDKILSSAKTMMEELARNIMGVPEDLIKNALKNLLKDIVETIPKPKIPTIGDIIEKPGPFGNYFEDKIINSIKQLSNNMKGHSMEKLDLAVKIIIEEFIEDVVSPNKSKLDDFKKQIEPIVQKFVPKILDVVYRLIEEHAKGNAANPADFIKHIIDDLKREIAESIGAKLKSSTPDLGEILGKIVPTGDEMKDKVLDTVKDIMKKIAGGSLGNAKDTVKNMEGAAKDIVEKLIKDIISPHESAPEHLQKLMQPIIKKITDKILGSTQEIMEKLTKKITGPPEDFIKNAIKSLLEDIIESIPKPKIPTIGDVLGKTAPISDHMEGQIVNSIKQLAINFKAHGVEKMDLAVKHIIEEFIKNVVSPDKSKLEDFQKRIEPIVKKFIPKIMDIVYRTIEEHAKDGAANPKDFIKHVINDLKREVVESIGAKLKSSVPDFGVILGKIVPISEEMKDEIINTIKDTLNKISDGILEKMKETFKNIIKDFIGNITSLDELKSMDFIKLGEKVIQDVGEKIMQVGKEIVEQFLKGGVKDFKDTVKELVKRSSHKNETSPQIECNEEERHAIPEGLVPDELLPVISKIVEELTKKGLSRNKDFIKGITDDLLDKLLNHSTEKPPINMAPHLDDSVEEKPPTSSTTSVRPTEEANNASLHAELGEGGPQNGHNEEASSEDNNDASLHAELGEGESHNGHSKEASSEENNDTSLHAELGEGGSNHDEQTEANKPSPGAGDGSLNDEEGENSSSEGDNSSHGEKSEEESEEEDNPDENRKDEKGNGNSADDKHQPSGIPEVIVTPTDINGTYRVTLNIDRLVHDEFQKFKHLRCECREGPIVNERCPLHSASKENIKQAIKQKFFRKLIEAIPIDEQGSQSGEDIILNAIKQLIKPEQNTSDPPKTGHKSPEIVPTVEALPKPVDILEPKPWETLTTTVNNIRKSEESTSKPKHIAEILESIIKPPPIIPNPMDTQDFGTKVLEGIHLLSQKLEKGEITKKQCKNIIHRIVETVKGMKDVGKNILRQVGQALADLKLNTEKAKGNATVMKLLSQLTKKFLNEIQHDRHHDSHTLQKRESYNFPAHAFQNGDTDCPTCSKSLTTQSSSDHHLKRLRKGIWEEFLQGLQKPEKFKMMPLFTRQRNPRVKRSVRWGCGSCGSQRRYKDNLKNNSTEVYEWGKVSARITRDEHESSRVHHANLATDNARQPLRLNLY